MISLLPSMRPDQSIEKYLSDRHDGYFRRAILFKYIYYVTRIVAGISAALLPFVMPYGQIPATILAAIIAIATVFDTVFVPRDRWKLYSITSDSLWVKQVRERGEYEKYKDRIDEILKAEAANVELASSIQELLDEVKKAQQPLGGPAQSGARPRGGRRKTTKDGAG